MGVALPSGSRLGQLATQAGWLIATLSAGALGPPVAPARAALVGGLALVAAWLAASGRVRAGGALLAIAAAPLWLAAAGIAQELRPGGGTTETHPALAAGLLCGSAALGLLGVNTALPRRLRLGIVALGALLALRSTLLMPTLGPPSSSGAATDVALGGMLLLATLVLAGCAAVPRRRFGLSAVALGLAAVTVGLGGRQSWVRAPSRPADVLAAAAMASLDHHAAALSAQPALGLYAISLSPTLHSVAVALMNTLGPGPVLDAGWRPEGAPVSPVQRVELALELDARGRGGEALRMCERARTSPAVAWTGLMLARDQGQSGQSFLAAARAPADVPRLPGELLLDRDFLSDGTLELVIEVTRPLTSLTLQTVGESWQGQPRLSIQLDADSWRTKSVPDGLAEISIAALPGMGPHRLRIRFDNDARGRTGDRNVRVVSLSGT